MLPGLFFLFGVAVISVGSNTAPPSLYTCIDWECEEWISQGKTMLRYSGKTDKHLSFQKNQDIYIVSKPVDKNIADWVGKIGNKVGLVPKDMVREDRMSKNPTKFKLDLQEILEIVGLASEDGQEEEDDEADDEGQENSSETDGVEIEDIDEELDNTNSLDADFDKIVEQVQKPHTEDVTTSAEAVEAPPATEVPQSVISATADDGAGSSNATDTETSEQKSEPAIESSLPTPTQTILEGYQEQQSAAVETEAPAVAVDQNSSSEGVPESDQEDLSLNNNQSQFDVSPDDIFNQVPVPSSAVVDSASSINLQPSTDTILQGSTTLLDDYYLTETPKTAEAVVAHKESSASLSVEDQVTPRIPETVLLDMTTIIQNQMSPASSSEQNEQIRATRVEKSESVVSAVDQEEETKFTLEQVEEKTQEPQTESTAAVNGSEANQSAGSDETPVPEEEEIVSPEKVETVQPHKLTEEDAASENKTLEESQPQEESEVATGDSSDEPTGAPVEGVPEDPSNESSSTENPFPGDEVELKVNEEENVANQQANVTQETVDAAQTENDNNDTGEQSSPPGPINEVLENVQDETSNTLATETSNKEEIAVVSTEAPPNDTSIGEEPEEEKSPGPLESPPSQIAPKEIEEEAQKEAEEPAPVTAEQEQPPESASDSVSPGSTEPGPLTLTLADFLAEEQESKTESPIESDSSQQQQEQISDPAETMGIVETVTTNATEDIPQVEESSSESPPVTETEVLEDEKEKLAEADSHTPEENATEVTSEADNSASATETTSEIPPPVEEIKENLEDGQSEQTNVTPDSLPVPDDDRNAAKEEVKPSEVESEQKDQLEVADQQIVSNEEAAVTETSTSVPSVAVPEVPVPSETPQLEAQVQQHSSEEETADHDDHHGHHNHHHHHRHRHSTKSSLNDSSSSPIIVVIKHLSSTLLSFLPEPLQDTILDVDDALVFTGIIALTLVSICVPYFFIEGYMSVRPLKKKVVELNKSLWKVSAAYETQQEEFEIFKRKAISHDEFKRRAEQSENDVVILKTLEQKHREQLQVLRTQLKSQMKEAKDIRALIEKTMRDKKIVEEEAAEYKAEAEKATESLQKAKEELAGLQTHAKSSALQLGMSSKNTEVLTTKIGLLEQETEHLKSQLEDECEKRKAIVKEMSTLAEEKSQVERELEDIKKICVQYEGTVDGLNNEICKLDSELTTIKETLGEDSPLLELAEIQAKAEFCEKEANSLRTRLEGVCADNENLTAKFEETKSILEETRTERDTTSKRLQVLETYFKEREEELLKTIETMQQKENVRDKGKDELIGLVEEKDEAIQKLNAMVESLREELDEQKGKHRTEIRNLESKGHENWLSLCQAERKAQDARKEAELLRQRLTAMAREAEGEDDDDDDSGGDGLSGQLSMMFPSVIPHELVPPPILDDGDDEPPLPSYFGLGDFVPPPPLDDEADGEEPRRRPPPLGGTRMSPSFSDFSDDDEDEHNNNILLPISSGVRRRREDECTDGSSGSGSPPLRSGGWVSMPQPGHRGDGGGGGSLRRLQPSSSIATSSPIQPGANL